MGPSQCCLPLPTGPHGNEWQIRAWTHTIVLCLPSDDPFLFPSWLPEPCDSCHHLFRWHSLQPISSSPAFRYLSQKYYKVYRSSFRDPRYVSPITTLLYRTPQQRGVSWQRLGPVPLAPGVRHKASDRGFGVWFSHLQTAICRRDYYYLYFVGEGETETNRSEGNWSKASQVGQLCQHKEQTL